ncbi:family 78 glycoside hydrolase catalytic domain [Nocardioides alkalitolerans]|uniref:family 78 glycoside hydrolase catalytic domain n=1 Tax=Nocardioides alkalitolerans TaxID=281714 RepID=UPI00040800DD|nr:family 78 glycoside hydrolase catalytic domain [Nocardioides alkalitolerans]
MPPPTVALPRSPIRPAHAGWRSASAVALLVLAGSFGVTPVASASSSPAGAVLGAVSAPESASTAPSGLSVNGLPGPVDLDVTPAFGWHVSTPRQTAYEVVVASSAASAAGGSGDVWASGRVASTEQTGIAYGGPGLAPSQRYWWAVRTYDGQGTASEWSAAASFGTGPGTSWSSSVPVWAPSPVETWRDYTIEARVRIDQVATGLTFRATDSSNGLMWQFRADNRLVPHTQVRGTYTALPAVALPAGTLAAGRSADLSVQVAGPVVRTSIDGVLVDERTITVAPQDTRGGIGVRHGRTESATYESVKVTAADGATLLDTTFADGDRTFACGTVAGGNLTVPNSGVCLQTGLTADWALLRGAVDVPDKEVAWATLTATASDPRPAKQYVHKLYLNGTFVGLGPTQPMGRESRYDGFDVTELVRAGENVVGAVAFTTSGQQFQSELVVAFTDGTRTVLGTDPGIWRARVASDVWPTAGSIGTSYFNAPKENLDLRAYPEGWDEPGYDASAWPAAVARPALGELRAAPMDKVEEQLRAPARVVEKAPGHYFVDFGRTWIGGVRLDLTEGVAGQRVDLRFGEVTSSADTVRYQLNTGNTYQDVVTLRDGEQTVETWGARVFRYVEIIGAPEAITAENLQALALVYPFDAEASRFASSSDNLNQVYALSKNTIESTNMNFYTDSWTRERTNYEADAYLQLMSTLYLMDDLSLGRYSMDYFRDNRTWPTEWPLYVVLAVHDAWRQTGDLTQAAAYYDNLALKLPDEWIDPATGLVGKNFRANGCNSQTDCDIVDWPASERDGYQFRHFNTVLNALSYRSYRDMAALAEALGETEDAATYTATADRLRAAMNERLYDPATGSYDDGMDASYNRTGHSALHASAFSLAFGVPADEQRPAVAAHVASQGMACSVYCAGFLIPGLYDGGEGQSALDLLTGTGTRSWMNMIALGAGATAEAWDPSLKGNLTYSHPWAASPAFSVPAGLFGIEPLTPGYRTFAVRPQPGDLEWATIATPTVRGSVGVGFDRSGEEGALRLAVSVPGNTAATVSVPTSASGPVTVYVDGSPRTVQAADGFAVVGSVPAGCHVLSTAPGQMGGSETDERLLSVCAAEPATGLSVVAEVSDAGDEGWYGAGAALTLTPQGDPGSDTAGLEYAIDGGEWTPYTTPVALAAGSYTVDHRWIDGDVVLASGSTTVQVDTALPTVTVRVDDQRRLVVEGADTDSGVQLLEYRLDDGEWTPWTGPVALGRQGVTATGRVTDVAGNVAEAQVAVEGAGPAASTLTSPGTATGFFGQDTLVPVTLTSEGTATGVVEAVWGGRVIGSGELRDGRATVRIPRTFAPNTYRVGLRYAGDATTAAASSGVVVTVNRARSTVIVSAWPQPVPTGRTGTLGIQVGNSSGAPYTGSVQVVYGGVRFQVWVRNGFARVTLPAMPTGWHRLRVWTDPSHPTIMPSGSSLSVPVRR